jgi:hypothetical protein
MLTDQDSAAARAEYEALPGTPPECYSAIDRDGTPMQTKVQDAIDLWRKEGMTHFRVTVEADCTWVEGWAVRPDKEAPFSPPYTAQS